MHAIFDDAVMGDISLMPYITWTNNGNGYGITVTETGVIAIPDNCSTGTAQSVVNASVLADYLAANAYVKNVGNIVVQDWTQPATASLVRVGPSPNDYTQAANVLILTDGFQQSDAANLDTVRGNTIRISEESCS